MRDLEVRVDDWVERNKCLLGAPWFVKENYS